MEQHGQKEGNLSAKVHAVTYIISVALNLIFEIDDILRHVTLRWMAIGRVINNVAGTMNMFWSMGSSRFRA